MGLRITTWNVNGIRNPFGYQPWREKRTFDGMFDILEADIVIMQELKIQRKDLRDDMVLVPGWDCYFSLPKHKKGYSGVGIFTRQAVCAPIRAEEGVLGVLAPPNSTTPYCDLPADQHIGGYLSLEQLLDVGVDALALDAEGRCVILEFPAFVLFGIYSPANSSGLRDDFRFGFLNALDKRIRNLVALGKRVVVTGDLNVSRQEIDTAQAEEAMKKEGITHEEYISTPNRRVFNQLLEGGLVLGERDEGREEPVMWDICRGFHPTRKGMFTHWEQKINARPGNFGSRIDFILCSLGMKAWFDDSNIQEGLMGSDHCPVYAIIKDQVEVDGDPMHIYDIMNPEGYFQAGSRETEYNVRDIPALSGKLLPEFDKRRSIRDMFGKNPSLRPTESLPKASAFPSASPSLSYSFTDNISNNSNELESATSEYQALLEQASQSTTSSTNAANTIASPNKKRSPPSPASTRTLKRAKSNPNPPPPNEPAKGQQTLKGFFKPKPTIRPLVEEESEPMKEYPELLSNSVKLANVNERASVTDTIPALSRQISTIDVIPPSGSPENPPSPEDIVDPIVSKESWSKLFAKPVAPRCEHEEPCKVMQTKKKGFNCGREFWMCARPLGPTGSKERNTQWRCPTFIWSSDWSGGTDKRS